MWCWCWAATAISIKHILDSSKGVCVSSVWTHFLSLDERISLNKLVYSMKLKQTRICNFLLFPPDSCSVFYIEIKFRLNTWHLPERWLCSFIFYLFLMCCHAKFLLDWNNYLSLRCLSHPPFTFYHLLQVLTLDGLVCLHQTRLITIKASSSGINF